METFLFEDGNCPGLVYLGNQDHYAGLTLEGGCPFRVHPKRILADGRVDCGIEGLVVPKPAPEGWARNAVRERFKFQGTSPRKL